MMKKCYQNAQMIFAKLCLICVCKIKKFEESKLDFYRQGEGCRQNESHFLRMVNSKDGIKKKLHSRMQLFALVIYFNLL